VLFPAGPQPRRGQPAGPREIVTPRAERLVADVHALAAFGTRFASSQKTPAVLAWLRGRIEAAGLDAYLERFPLRVGERETEQVNLHAAIPGRDPGLPRLLLVAHYDSIDEGWEGGRSSLADPETPAPGAGDNGSGVAVLLECMRLFAASPPERGVDFLFSAAEEMGQEGSRHWAEADAARLARIGWVLNVDQVGRHRSGPRALQLFTRDAGIPFVRRIVALSRSADAGLLGWRLHLDDRLAKSDHGPFLARGLASASLSEGPGYYPWSAQGAGDLPDRIDPLLLVQAARLVTAIARDPDLPLPDAARPPGSRR